ncbi:MAG: NAD(P)/FAD-dependent oxidoreductase [Acidobacteria bacterium]|nr:NAD(P)/FAD-dependent oxidoreductase [Acidobacteriota bacterium]MBI3425158.1 NAD(P)/FAD-dependent oxidoreductase [Acidobacteriota bacterium]
MNQKRTKPKVVIIGGGFGGLRAARLLGNQAVEVTLIDRKNHHTFQPLLYQVATAVLSPGEIAMPIRHILRRYKNIKVVLGEVVGFDHHQQTVKLNDGAQVDYDYLIVAAGARHSYFGRDEWEHAAPGLKTIEDAVEIRRRVLLAFELAERKAVVTGAPEPVVFAVIGGGPTGVELAGAIAGVAQTVLADDFKLIDTRQTRVLLFEHKPHVLATFAAELSQAAERHLRELGVEVFPHSLVTEVEAGRIKVGDEWIKCDVALWGTGVAASPLGKALGAELDRAGKVRVRPDLSIVKHPNIFAIGDMAFFEDERGVVPGVAPAAMQQAECAVGNILSDMRGAPRTTFRYVDKGSMATIGRNRAIAQIGGWRFSGNVAWLLWLLVHVVMLLDPRHRLQVVREWLLAYFTHERSALLITGEALRVTATSKSNEIRLAHSNRSER